MIKTIGLLSDSREVLEGRSESNAIVVTTLCHGHLALVVTRTRSGFQGPMGCSSQCFCSTFVQLIVVACSPMTLRRFGIVEFLRLVGITCQTFTRSRVTNFKPRTDIVALFSDISILEIDPGSCEKCPF